MDGNCYTFLKDACYVVCAKAAHKLDEHAPTTACNYFVYAVKLIEQSLKAITDGGGRCETPSACSFLMYYMARTDMEGPHAMQNIKNLQAVA